MSSLLLHIKVYRLEIQLVMLVFSTKLCELFPLLTFSLVYLPPPFQKPKYIIKDSVWGGGGGC
jgi:hypothetical protein